MAPSGSSTTTTDWGLRLDRRSLRPGFRLLLIGTRAGLDGAEGVVSRLAGFGVRTLPKFCEDPFRGEDLMTQLQTPGPYAKLMR